MTKTQLVSKISDKCEIASVDVKAVLDALAEVVQAALKRAGDGDRVTIPGVVALKRKHVAATRSRPGRNPLTGEDIMIKAKPAHYKVRALPVKALKDAVTK